MNLDSHSSLEAAGESRARTLDELRRHLQRINDGRHGLLPLGVPAIDAALGGGLARGGVHEVAASDEGAAAGLATVLAARLSGSNLRSVLWIVPAGGPYAPQLFAPALAMFGLDPTRLMLVTASRPADRLWAMEEALRCRALAAVIAEIDAVALPALRRLQLAAEGSGVAGLLLRAGSAAGERGGGAVTRWQVESAPSKSDKPRWRLALLRSRSGRAGQWLVEWSHETGGLALVAALRDGPPETDPAGQPEPWRADARAAAMAPHGAG
jgi:protein ImuA